ncbi:type II toxin-antitoxin system RelB/DinJ family antitoxin [Microcystis aeruginosa BLCCF158]|uniref:Type II toxin-antitoxin system RelB/DinJ family antitoxin n=1 Tax=Microcystis aeruginosa BLCC-F158 TaxID=2755316 RepID=A0A841UZ84_MICAE|nr:type II toxin-antitoxin system RelB/DinJ family antitoxin [Microcystis aeruginosa]MBC1196453.1 type II toxin-antitoxin system RelB/DinJ family antitoxin [Microcystis aeruginosa BLCC-F158]
MSETSIIQANVEPELRASAEEIFKQLGLTTNEAITLFYEQVAIHKSLPFPVNTPDQTTEEIFQKTDQVKELISCEDTDDMFNQLGI